MKSLERVKLFNRESEQTMYNFITNGQVQFDSIITDPPYGINYNNEYWDKKDKLNWYNISQQFYDLTIDTANIIIFAGWSNSDELRSIFESTGFTLNNKITWDRIKGRGAKKNFTSTAEEILWFVKDPKNYTFNKEYSETPKATKGMGQKNGQPNRSLSNVWTDIPPIVPWSKERNEHPTQKPLKLMRRIVRIFTNEDDMVFDPFMGSGTTGEACFIENRRFTGIEREEKWFKICENRIKTDKKINKFI